jgi:hypothetical protein
MRLEKSPPQLFANVQGLCGSRFSTGSCLLAPNYMSQAGTNSQLLKTFQESDDHQNICMVVDFVRVMN